MSMRKLSNYEMGSCTTMNEPPVWPDTTRRNEFFDRLQTLIGEYPELTSTLVRMHQQDPADSYWDQLGDTPGYNPSSPVMITGIALLIATTNTEGWEEMVLTEPHGQSIYMTHGMIGEALNMTGREY